MPKNFDVAKGNGLVDLRKNVNRSVAEPAMRAFNNSGARKIMAPITARSKRTSKRSPLLGFLIFLLFLLVGATVASFFIFNQGSGKNSLKLTLKGPKEQVAGSALSFEITYQNLDKVALNKMELVAEYPEGFYFEYANAEPNNQDKTVWGLPDLADRKSVV